ncbi:Uncharacterised protein [Sphingobacterium multivorum]|nr:Uncharacterised protein [Sphingobacterium multivorum]
MLPQKKEAFIRLSELTIPVYVSTAQGYFFKSSSIWILQR